MDVTDLIDRLKEVWQCWRDMAIELYQRFVRAYCEIKQMLEAMPLWEADLRNQILRKAKYLRRMAYIRLHHRKRKKPLHRRRKRR